MKPKPPVPVWRWGLWYSVLGPALVLFYGVFTAVLVRPALARLAGGVPFAPAERSGGLRRRRAG